MTEPVEQLDVDVDLLRKEQEIQNLLDDFDFFVEHLDEEQKKGNYIQYDEEDGRWHIYYHNISDMDCADEREALEKLFDHIRMVESEELKEQQNLPF